MASEATNNDKVLLKILGGEKLLITIIFVGTAVLSFILWTNRHISRMLLISKKGPHTSIGNDAPKELKKATEKCFGLISKLAIEPKLLCDQGNKDFNMSSFVERRDESTYFYRRKAFDLMNCLDDLLCRVDVCLASKHGQTIKEHFTELQKPPYAPFVDCNELCDNVVEKYEHARFGCKSFEFADYQSFAEDMDALTQKVYSSVPVPGSLLLPSNRVDKAGSLASSDFDRGQSQGIINIESTKEAKVVFRSKEPLTQPMSV